MPPQILEGTWEEITQHAAELSGHRVRVTVLDDKGVGKQQPLNGDAPPQAEETLDKVLEGYVGALKSGTPHNDARRSKEIWGEYLMEKDRKRRERHK